VRARALFLIIHLINDVGELIYFANDTGVFLRVSLRQRSFEPVQAIGSVKESLLGQVQIKQNIGHI
jgi:hypothetical protein